ncbi:MAG: carboxylesterase family protein [Actinomycetota bacterium]|nr:carboxylesterase family protein [Actinomycetota bacterium]
MTHRRRALLGAALALGLSLAVSGCLFSPSRDMEVVIDDGTLRGVADDGVRSWLGIPYAAPPVDDLRWRPPEPPAPWSDVRHAQKFESECVQVGPEGVSDTSSEDCLYLNVFRPDTDEKELPVMVWLHGGGLTVGNGNLALDMVAGLVEHGVVVVSINYRLGRLGYFAHSALATEGGKAGPVANFGLLDQVAALRWVQDNVAEFGGDPAAVTIFGISAGGASVNYLMTSPLAKGLFARAISGSGLGREQPPTWQEAAAEGEALAAAVGRPSADAATLRGLDAGTVAALPTYQLRDDIPILDPALPMSVADAFARGHEAAVPYLVGSTDAELLDATYLQALGVDPVAERERYAAGHEAEVGAAYGDERDQHLLNDLIFTEPARYLAEQHVDRAPTYRYRFSIASDEAAVAFGGAIHGSDLPFVFGWADGAPKVDNAKDLAEEVSGCWASFATTGTPSCGGVEWPQADDGLVELTNDGPDAGSDDPWQERLDLVEGIREQLAAATP